MESVRPYFWITLLLAMILVSLVIVIIFIIINVCISKRAARYKLQAEANNYSDPKLQNNDNQVTSHSDFKNEKPPLPPRDQFTSTNSVNQSYEDLECVPDYVVAEGSTFPVTQQSFTTVQTKSQDLQSIPDYDDVEIPNSDSEDYDEVG